MIQQIFVVTRHFSLSLLILTDIPKKQMGTCPKSRYPMIFILADPGGDVCPVNKDSTP